MTTAARAALLTAICRAAEGADVKTPAPAPASSETNSRIHRARRGLAAVLRDTRFFSVLGGRPDLPRSLGSVHAASVVRFLAGFRGDVLRVFEPEDLPALVTPPMAVTRDGATLLFTDRDAHALHAVRTSDGGYVRQIGGFGTSKLQFNEPNQAFVARDDFVFVADTGNSRIQILTPAFEFHAFFGACYLNAPMCVCVDAACVVVLDKFSTLTVFRRAGGAPLWRTHNIRTAIWPRSMFFVRSPWYCDVEHRRFVFTDDFRGRVSVYELSGAWLSDMTDSYRACNVIPHAVVAGNGEIVFVDSFSGSIHVVAVTRKTPSWRGFKGFKVREELSQALAAQKHKDAAPLGEDFASAFVDDGTLYVFSAAQQTVTVLV
jgi:hypothetical protein